MEAPALIHKHSPVRAVDTEHQSYPVPGGTTDQTLNDLVTGLKSVGPTQVQSVVALIPALFPPGGTNVRGILGCVGSDSSRLRISFWISDLADGRDVAHLVIEDPPPATGNAPASTPRPAPSAERFQALFEVAARLLALVLARRALMNVPLRNRLQHKKYRAEIANIIGSEYVTSAQNFERQKNTYYDRAVESFLEAQNLKPDMYQAFVNLGDTYHYRDQQTRAISQYNQAKKLVFNKKMNRSNSLLYRIDTLWRQVRQKESNDLPQK
jgi:tetratricopeptide (TPR) repeat protein